MNNNKNDKNNNTRQDYHIGKWFKQQKIIETPLMNNNKIDKNI